MDRAAIIKYYRWGGLNNKILSPHNSGGWLSQTTMPAWLAFGWQLSSWLARGSLLAVTLLGRALRTSSNPNYFPELSSPPTITLQVRAPPHEFWERCKHPGRNRKCEWSRRERWRESFPRRKFSLTFLETDAFHLSNSNPKITTHERCRPPSLLPSTADSSFFSSSLCTCLHPHPQIRNPGPLDMSGVFLGWMTALHTESKVPRVCGQTFPIPHLHLHGVQWNQGKNKPMVQVAECFSSTPKQFPSVSPPFLPSQLTLVMSQAP